MRDVQHRLGRRPQLVCEPSLPGDVEKVVGLVEQQHVSGAAQQHLQREPFLFPARQRRERPVPDLRGVRRNASARQLSHNTSARIHLRRPSRRAPRVSTPSVSFGWSPTTRSASVSLAAARSRGAASLTRTSAPSRRRGSRTSWRMTPTRPSIRTVPSERRRRRRAGASRVDLPTPFSPTSATGSPLPTLNDTSWNSPCPLPGRFHAKPCTSMAPTGRTLRGRVAGPR